MTEEVRSPLTDSPWFWVLTFSAMSLAALGAISGKYGKRQSMDERQYQAAERVAAGESGPAASSESTGRRPYAKPGDTLIPLWPLALTMFAIAIVAAAMLWRSHRRTGPSNRQASS